MSIKENNNEWEERPWGTYEVLYDGDDCKVKRIVVRPGQNPSYQYHHKRREHWIMISGTGKAKVNGELIPVSAGDVVDVATLVHHTIINDSEEDLVFIEIQTGTYFGEDDILSLEDKYGRS